MATAVHHIKANGGNVHTSTSTADSASWLEAVYMSLTKAVIDGGLDAVAARHPNGSGALLTFDELQIIGAVGYSESVRSNFGKMLMTVSGMSADKAAVVLVKYRTLGGLRAAYRAAGPDAGKTLLAGEKVPGARNSFGRSLSNAVWRAFWADE
ncbi:uncharacterized protein AMSG_02764 [Thecamonas trahens ATCC 50062]|uniref:Uncharacterized protein n=1 Tax=Thecamonas trahens ATCC 50062 TaxID=461836 RepID=A0A0L0D4T0_THETB|nr:hypothetical protein AMSG_02764 [Thecamonas trahens ATCC 50062]KNC46313.1 hypothetical protein AMSG_02764 [Thecamonas trahens ATCC 50062]|eukprot:XP_013760606.1 hypothetical protein AMSG_02764 [Thecamonas trahens ATCC 50062]